MNPSSKRKGRNETQGESEIALTAGGGNTQIAGSLADPTQLQAWKDYWSQNARPVIVTKPNR